MNNLEARRAALINELNRQIKANAGMPVEGQLPAQISRQLNRIQRVNEQISLQTKAALSGLLDQQDALAERVFGDCESGPELRAEINRVSESIEDFVLNLSNRAYYYAAA